MYTTFSFKNSNSVEENILKKRMVLYLPLLLFLLIQFHTNIYKKKNKKKLC